ncbi:type VI secretion system baseplate subunit TssG [Niabella beijingensis]|uniref:type VI secretion system baseplate subunit TssG n=1 Tax=Niabella beijingensis TaxID=2872700 RepID=UPI001CBC36D9|nr:type VI secretion system baseplate subunit TssG [Niabella beijingensis]MBZ4188478.1 type VI secretion system baseplate subunit TssG [Niabella beijingensis]
MKKEEKIQYLWKLLQERDTDVKAEVLLNHAIENGFPGQGYVTHNNGYFYREFVKDIFGASVIEDDWYRMFLEIRLSRPGFYDMLPEALFHQPETNEFRQRSGVAEMIDRYKKNQAKETETRKFFQPFENEFFYQQLMLEKEEINLLDILKSKILTRYFLDFWGLPPSFKIYEAASFLLLLPYAHQISGNLPVMESCLKALLNEPVQIIRKEPELIHVEAADGLGAGAGLGGAALGDAMVCGAEFMEDYPVLQYRIGPLKHNKVSDFINNKEKDILIQTFNDYFAPVEADIEVEILVAQQAGEMSFDEDSEVILGYSSIM